MTPSPEDEPVRLIRREIYERLPDFHRLTVDLLVVEGKWRIVEPHERIQK